MLALALTIVLCFTVLASVETTVGTHSAPEHHLGSLLADCAVYLKNIDALSKDGFEGYASTLGFDITLHPDFQLLTDEGFCPVCLKDDRFVQNDGGEPLFLTGFECYPCGWLNNSYDVTKPNEEEASFVLLIRCYSGINYLGSFITYLLGAYCVKYCGGVFEDFEAGMCFDDLAEIERAIAVFADDLTSWAEQGQLYTIPFEGWF